MAVQTAWKGEPDMENRDPNELNAHLKVTFEECIGEPDHTHSIDCVWKYSYKCFNLWKTMCYIICTVLCGIPHAICWGCTFACVAFVHVWEVTPCIRCYGIQLAIVQKCNTLIFGAICNPMCESFGALFSAFKK